MRTAVHRFLAASFLTVVALSACDYEFKDEPAGTADQAVGDEEDAESSPAKQEAPKPPEVRPVLPAGKAYSGSSTLPANAKRIELLNLAATNQATLSTNVPGADVANIFDGDPETLLRSPDINPVEATIAFTAPTKIKAIKVRSTYSDFGVAVQIDNGERIILDPIPEGDWATMVWTTPQNAKKIVVHTLRKVRDNVVHLNEIEIYQ